MSKVIKNKRNPSKLFNEKGQEIKCRDFKDNAFEWYFRSELKDFSTLKDDPEMLNAMTKIALKDTKAKTTRCQS
jgi:hypothetical protein